MKLLLLGGPLFLGRHIIDAALSANHEVTLFNRGKTNPDLYPDIEKLRGDRDGDLSVLNGRTWDVVIDTCGYVPRHVDASAKLLAKAAEHYTFVSSLSVYTNTAVAGLDESAPVGTLEDETVEEVTNETYGPLKALCEQAAEKHFPNRAIHVRAGLIVGPNDPSDRFTYWPMRFQRGGEVLAPENRDAPVQFVDVRDLAGWMVRMAEKRTAGVFNATGPATTMSMETLLSTCQAVSNSDATMTWVDEAFLLEKEVGPWMELPLWLPSSDEDAAGFMTIDCSRAMTAGLTFRPLAETVRDTIDWAMQRDPDWAWRAGMDAEKETAVLAAWHQR